MTVADIGLGEQLRAAAGWNQTRADWQRFVELEPDGCFVAEWNGQPAGTTVACTFDRVAWIAMVLVDASLRGQGIGTRLMEYALAWLDRRGVSSVRLDATPWGRPSYGKLGCVDEYELVRMAGVGQRGAPLSVLHDTAREALFRLDAQATATPRHRLLEALLRQQPQAVRVTADAYLMYRPGSRATQIGPAVALRAEAGLALADWALAQCDGLPVYVDIPTVNGSAMEWAATRGLVDERRLMRMCRGPRVADHPEWIWASSGPEMG